MNSYTDISLIHHLKIRERDAFKHLVLNYSSLFMTKAVFYCRNKQDAEDALQESFIIIYRKLPDFQGENKNAFLAWCNKIVINNCLSKYRKKYYSFERNEILEGTEAAIDPSVYSKLGKEEIYNQISQLPEGYKEIFSLFAIDGFSHKEIAAQLNIKESTSRSQYVRAKKKLKSQMDSLFQSNIVL